MALPAVVGPGKINSVAQMVESLLSLNISLQKYTILTFSYDSNFRLF